MALRLLSEVWLPCQTNLWCSCGDFVFYGISWASIKYIGNSLGMLSMSLFQGLIPLAEFQIGFGSALWDCLQKGAVDNPFWQSLCSHTLIQLAVNHVRNVYNSACCDDFPLLPVCTMLQTRSPSYNQNFCLKVCLKSFKNKISPHLLVMCKQNCIIWPYRMPHPQMQLIPLVLWYFPTPSQEVQSIQENSYEA